MNNLFFQGRWLHKLLPRYSGCSIRRRIKFCSAQHYRKLIGLVVELQSKAEFSLQVDDISVWASGFPCVQLCARLQRAVNVRQNYLQLILEKCFFMVFTRRSTKRYPLFVNGEIVLVARRQMFWGFMIDWKFTWSPRVLYPIRKITAAIILVNFISGTGRAATVASFMRLHEALFVVRLR